ncbi:three-helix bundle dimerization domain-containing protein [Streptomyces sp. KL116D]|uniref:three-helix bundle dimerization domain-containing protein n=1 Tax=Streptomyces sp. KL116D TaxID=3045152 RepID=UPI003556AA5A
MTDTSEGETIRGIVERLTNIYSATHSPADVETAVGQAYSRFDDVPIRDFVPVLVERKARTVLSRMNPGSDDG